MSTVGFDAGSSGSPGLYINGDTGTGLTSTGAGNINLSVEGYKTISIFGGPSGGFAPTNYLLMFTGPGNNGVTLDSRSFAGNGSPMVVRSEGGWAAAGANGGSIKLGATGTVINGNTASGTFKGGDCIIFAGDLDGDLGGGGTPYCQSGTGGDVKITAGHAYSNASSGGGSPPSLTGPFTGGSIYLTAGATNDGGVTTNNVSGGDIQMVTGGGGSMIMKGYRYSTAADITILAGPSFGSPQPAGTLYLSGGYASASTVGGGVSISGTDSYGAGSGAGGVTIATGSWAAGGTKASIVNKLNGTAALTIQDSNGGVNSNVVMAGTAGITIPSGTTGQRPSTPVNGMIRYSSTLGIIEGYQSGAWGSLAAPGVTSVAVSSTGGTITVTGSPITTSGTINIDIPSVLRVHGQCRFAYVSTTSVKLGPYNGSGMVINGTQYSLPSGGVSANNTSVYVNGTSGQNLVANTLYYVYLFNNGGTLTLNFSTTAHVTDSTAGNVGIEIMSGNSNMTLVGMVYMDGNAHFAETNVYRLVASWFNRQNKVLQGSLVPNLGYNNTGWQELYSPCRVYAVNWADDAVTASLGGFASNIGNPGYCLAIVGVDGTGTFASASYGYMSSWGGTPQVLTTPGSIQPSEGLHYYTPAGLVSGGTTGYFNVGIQGTIHN